MTQFRVQPGQVALRLRTTSSCGHQQQGLRFHDHPELSRLVLLRIIVDWLPNQVWYKEAAATQRVEQITLGRDWKISVQSAKMK